MKGIISLKKICIIFLIFGMEISMHAQDTINQLKQVKSPSKATTGFIDPNIYYDSRNSYDFTLNVFAVLPNRFQYFTFTNYGSSNENSDLTKFYSEHHLYWSLTAKSPFDLSLQAMAISGEKNDALRLGFRWRAGNTPKLEKLLKKIGLTYNLAFHCYQFDSDNNRSPWLAQIEHFYRFNLFKNRIYISGFADQDIYYNKPKIFTFVTEHQLGIRLIDNFFVVAEYRFNDYFPSKKQGVGFGLEYFIKL